MGVDTGGKFWVAKIGQRNPDVIYLPPNTSLAMVCSCMFEVPS
jgi:hypothetical protein